MRQVKWPIVSPSPHTHSPPSETPEYIHSSIRLSSRGQRYAASESITSWKSWTPPTAVSYVKCRSYRESRWLGSCRQRRRHEKDSQARGVLVEHEAVGVASSWAVVAVVLSSAQRWLSFTLRAAKTPPSPSTSAADGDLRQSRQAYPAPPAASPPSPTASPPPTRHTPSAPYAAPYSPTHATSTAISSPQAQNVQQRRSAGWNS